MSLCSFVEEMVWVIDRRVDVVVWCDDAASKFHKATRVTREACFAKLSVLDLGPKV